jgi:TatD DNase family protein
MWFDTHIHLNAQAYHQQHTALLQQARQANINGWVIPSVYPKDCLSVPQLAHQIEGANYALGIHPMVANEIETNHLSIAAADHVYETALNQLHLALDTHKHDPKLVAIGEIGLDFFTANADALLNQRQYSRQIMLFTAQVKLAQRYQLPVLLHIRKAHDKATQILKQHGICQGIAHAFNGSEQQAHKLIDLGFHLGFGGAATYTRALHIRRLLNTLPEHCIVLETDAPYLPPAWLSHEINLPSALAKIGEHLASIRQIPAQEFAQLCHKNSRCALPKLI